MKKMGSLLMSLLLLGSVVSCGVSTETTGDKSSDGTEGATKTYKVGIIQIVEHPSLNEIREATIAELEQLVANDPQMGKLQIDYKNAQGDSSNLNTICKGFVSDQKDVIIAIATPSALAAVSAVEGTTIPVIYSAVTNPDKLGLAPESGTKPTQNVTGTGYAIPVNEIMDLALEINPAVKTVGLIYNQGESNSVVSIDQAKAYLKEKGIKVEEATVSSTNDLQMAGNALIAKKVDFIFSPDDNTVASGFTALSALVQEAKIPYYVGADSMVKDGGFATIGINYTFLGKETAKLTKDVLAAGRAKDVDVIYITEYTKMVNEDVAKALNISITEDSLKDAIVLHTGDNEKAE